jgi:hypothetical protein
VLTLHRRPHEFSEDDLTAAETIASLVAGGGREREAPRAALRSVHFRSLADLAADGRRRTHRRPSSDSR